MRVLVTGGSGLLGRTTIAALAARGHEVVALQRRESAELTCEQVLADVCDREAVAAAAERCDAVVHGAARVGVVGTREEFRRANVGGTEAVVAACREAGVPRLVVVSSPSVGYESVPTVGAGAEAPIEARGDGSWYSESKAEAELVALAANGPALSVTASASSFAASAAISASAFDSEYHERSALPVIGAFAPAPIVGTDS